MCVPVHEKFMDELFLSRIVCRYCEALCPLVTFVKIYPFCNQLRFQNMIKRSFI